MPVAPGVQLVEKLAVPELIVPVPEMTGLPLQTLLAYRPKPTDWPLRPKPPVTVAVSPAVTATPTVPVVGLATVVMLGLLGPITTVSSAPPQALNGLLFESPA